MASIAQSAAAPRSLARPDRLVIVRRGDTELHAGLLRRFANDPEMLVFYDRRSAPRRTFEQQPPLERRRGERRFPQDPAILAARGFFVTRCRLNRSRRHQESMALDLEERCRRVRNKLRLGRLPIMAACDADRELSAGTALCRGCDELVLAGERRVTYGAFALHEDCEIIWQAERQRPLRPPRASPSQVHPDKNR